MAKKRIHPAIDPHYVDTTLSSCLHDASSLISQCHSSIVECIDALMVSADNAIQAVQEAILQRIDYLIDDAGMTILDIKGKIDDEITQAVIFAWIAAQQAGADLPDIPLGDLEQRGFAVQLPPKKQRKKRQSAAPDPPQQQELPQIPDPSNPYGLPSQTPYVQPVACPAAIPNKTSEPKTSQTNIPSSGNYPEAGLAQNMGQTSPNVNIGCPPPQVIVLQPCGEYAQRIPVGPTASYPSAIGTPSVPTIPPISPFPPNADRLAQLGAGESISPAPSTPTEAPKEPYRPEDPIIAAPPLETASKEPQFAGLGEGLSIVLAHSKPELPPVKLKSEIDLDDKPPTECMAAERLDRFRRAAILAGHNLIFLPTEDGAVTVSRAHMAMIVQSYWGKYGELADEFKELADKYVHSEGLRSFTAMWRDVITKAVGDYSIDVYCLSACRAWLASCQLSMASVSNTGDLSAALSHMAKTNFKGNLGASIPFLPEKLTSGLGGGIEGSLTLDKAQTAKASFNLGVTIQPFIAPMISTLDMLIESASHTNTLTNEQAVACYLRGGLHYDCLVNIVNLNGGDMTEWDRVIWASSERLNTGEIIAAWRRDLITDKQRDTLLRKIGWLSNKQSDIAVKLTDYIPGPSNLIRYMVRDVADKDTVDRFNLHAEFKEKWIGKLREMGFAQGISDEVALMEWAAHWDLPGMRSVYDALHRFRDDGSFDGPKHLVTTKDEVSKILAYNDMLPVWRDRLVALSYDPLTRVDAQRAYMIGVIDKDRLYKAFRDIGYDKTNAETLVEFTGQRRDNFLVNAKPSKQYRDGFITKDQLKQRLARYKVTDDEFKYVTETMELEARIAVAKQCAKGMRAKYLHGELSNKEAKEALIEQGYPLDHAERLIAGWECERRSQSKAIQAEKLCKLREAMLISSIDYQARLVRLGYSSGDARLLASHCEGAKDEKDLKDKQRKEESQKRAEEKLQKEIYREKDKEKKADLRATSEAEAEQKRSAARKVKLRNTAHELATALGVDLVAAVDEIEKQIAKIMERLEVSRESAEKLLIGASKHYWPKSSGDYGQYIDKSIDAYDSLAAD